MIKTLTFGTLCLAFSAFAAQAAAPANDVASDPVYNDGWTTADNGGSGFLAWSTLNQHFIGSSTLNGPGGSSPGIDTGGESFGLFSNSGAQSFAQAVRPFSSSLQIGESFIMSFDNGTVGSNGSVGFALRNAANNSLFQFYFLGGTNSYTIDAGGVTQQTAHGFTAAGMNTIFTLTGANTFSFSIQFNDNTTVEHFTGTLTNPGGAITNVRLFAINPEDMNGSQSDVYYNNLQIVPEPSSFALMAGPAIVGAWFFVRRRRS